MRYVIAWLHKLTSELNQFIETNRPMNKNCISHLPEALDYR